MKPLIALLSLLLLVPGEAHAGKGAQPIYFRTSVKLTVDASGKVQAAEAPADMPKALRDVIEAQARDWRFQPLSTDGGVTYALAGACAIPMQDGGYRLAVDYKANGPRVEGSNDGWLPPPRYPEDAARSGQEADSVVDFTVHGDGHATLNGISYARETKMVHRYFDEAIKQWIEGMRYAPEQVNGTPVATRMRVPVDFMMTNGSYAEKKYVQREQAATPECQAATASRTLQLPVAVDSPFKKLDAG